MNVFIAIIEEAYVSTRMQNKNNLIFTYLKLDPEYVEFKEDDDFVPGNKGGRMPERKTTGTLLPEQLIKYDKDQKDIKKAIYSKNTLREALNINYEKILNTNPKDKAKVEIENILQEHFNSVSLNFLLNIL